MTRYLKVVFFQNSRSLFKKWEKRNVCENSTYAHANDEINFSYLTITPNYARDNMYITNQLTTDLDNVFKNRFLTVFFNDNHYF